MTVTDILKSMKFIVDQEGKPTAALLDMDVWEAFLSMLEDMEDTKLIRERTQSWHSKEGWTRWEDLSRAGGRWAINSGLRMRPRPKFGGCLDTCANGFAEPYKA